MADDLDRGRAAYEDRRWLDAVTLLSAADRISPLAVSDLALLSQAAALIGRDDIAFAVMDRGYEISLSQGLLQWAFQVAFWRAFRLFGLGDIAQATAWIARAERAVAQLGVDCAERGYLLLPQARRCLAMGDAAAAKNLASKAMCVGDKYHDTDLSAMAREMAGRAFLREGDVPGGLALLDEAMLLVSQGKGSELVRGLVYCAVIAGCQEVFALDRAREWTTVLAQWCDAQPQLGIFNGACRLHRAEIMQIEGNWKRALDEVSSLAQVQSGKSDRAGAAYQEAEIYRFRGDYAAAELAYHRASELGGETQPGLALLRLAQGKADAAAGGIRRIVLTTTDPLRRARFLPAFVEVMTALGEKEEAGVAAAELVKTAKAHNTPALRAIASHANGTVALASGDMMRALPLLKEAFAIWQELNAPYLSARIRVDIARACEALGDTEGASLERDAARKEFARLHARPDLEKLDAVKKKRTANELLSRREIEVLRLVAAGHTNKLIAAELAMSSRTVDRHIGNILVKLDVPSRTAATAFAYQHRLIED